MYQIQEITLLTKKEAEGLPLEIRNTILAWWLRTPGIYRGTVMAVNSHGEIENGINACNENCGIRPVLQISNLNPNLKLHSVVRILDREWIVIGNEKVLSKHIVGFTAFRKRRPISDGEDMGCYESSDIKRWLEEWLRHEREQESQNS